MPKVLLTERQRNMDADKKANELLVKRIRATVSALGLNNEGFAARLGLSYGTFNRRMHNPDTFTLREMREIERLFNKVGIAYINQ